MSRMCCHKMYIYGTCGHSVFSEKPLVLCRLASIPPDGSFSTRCEILAHPFQSWNIDSLCPECDARRTRLLSRIEIMQVIKYDEWQWKVSYGMPAHGKDFWGKKADERVRLEQETGKRTKRSLRFNWMRSRSTRKSKPEAGD